MANMTPSRIGANNGGGDKTELFLKVFSGEVLTAFAESNVASQAHTIRTITSGKSAQFPATWKGGAAYHTPGTQLLGTGIGHSERVIVVDDQLVADRSLSDLDEAMNHYDVRSVYSADIGRALARTFDENVLKVMVLAARAAATVTGANGGTRLIGSSIGTAVADLEGAAFDAAQAMDEKDVPDTDRFLFLKPAQYYLLVSGTSKLVNTDWVPEGAGGYAAGVVKRIAGMQIVKTNNLPTTNVTTGPTAYRGNFSSVVGVSVHKSAVGTVKLMDLKTSVDWLPEYLTHLLVGRYAVGHGILRPESAVELASSATS